MGANAQTTVPTFTASQVLTADQMNQSARTGVPVFATTGTRDAAFGGTGEKTLAEGQMCYVEGTGFQTYNGTAWVTWGAAPADSGLTLISSTTIGTAVSSVTVSNCFSATYDNYKIIVGGGTSSGQVALRIQFGATTTGYYGSRFNQFWGATSSQFGTNNGSTTPDFGFCSGDGMSGTLEVISPFLSVRTFYSGWGVMPGTNTSLNEFALSGGYVNNTTSYTGFTLLANTSNITGGTIKVYGYKN